MFEVKGKKEIGAYLKDLIEKKYSTYSDFCRAYLKVSGSKNEDNEFDNLKNRISSIVNGKKDIQLYDFPAFTKLLNVSCEEILSAGDTKSVTSNHLTNYQIACSHDKNLWEFCIHNENSTFLNPDEYDKTIIDYALEFKNYDFLKYLMNNEYIWFVSKNPKNDSCIGFGAGTSVKRRPLGSSKILESRLTEDDSLRRKMMVLAIEKGDIKMLDNLKAREIPPMCLLNTAGNRYTYFEKYYDADLVEALSKANEAVLDYFSEEFTVRSIFRNIPHKYMFPSIGELLDKLIVNNNKCTEAILRRCIEHNKNTYIFIKKIVDRQTDYYHRCYFDYSKDGNIISVQDYSFNGNKTQPDGIVTNIIRIKSKSDSFVVSNLINELNKYFDAIIALNPEKGEK